MSRFLVITIAILLSISQLMATPVVVANGKQLRQKPRLLNGTHYTSLRDIAKVMDYSVFHKRKSNSYDLIDEKHKLIGSLSEGDQSLTLNGKSLKFNKPIKFERGRVYLPLSETYKALGQTVSITDETITIQRPGYNPTIDDVPKKLISKKLIPKTLKKQPSFSKRRSQQAASNSSQKRNDKISVDRPVYLLFKDRKINLTGKVFYTQNTLMVWSGYLFKKEGYSVAEQDNSCTYSRGGSSFSFTPQSKSYKRSRSGQLQTKTLNQAATLKGGQLYIPLQDIIKDMGLSLIIDSRLNELYAVKKINSISYIAKKGDPQFLVSTPSGVTLSSPQSLAFKRGYYIDIPFTDARHLKTIEINDSDIRKLEITQKQGHTTRIIIRPRKQLRYPSLSSQAGKTTISFNTLLTDISLQGSALLLSATHDIDPTIAFHQNPPRFVIDFENTVNALPSTLPLKSPNFKGIRTSQFKDKPPTTRVVIDLQPGVDALLSQKRSTQVAVTFPPLSALEKPRYAIAKKTPPPTRLNAKPKAKFTKLSPKVKLSGAVSGKTIIIDAGHGGRDPGAVVHKSVYEKKFTLDIARRLERRLRKQGAVVIMTRNRDRDISLSRRALIANKSKADAYVSVHINSFVKSRAGGTETYYYKSKDRRLARALQAQLQQDLALPNNGVKRARLYVLRHTKMPAALVEPLFMTNSKEFNLIQKGSYREKIAASLEKGLLTYFAQTPSKKKSRRRGR